MLGIKVDKRWFDLACARVEKACGRLGHLAAAAGWPVLEILRQPETG